MKYAGFIFLLSCFFLVFLTGCMSQLKSTPEPAPTFSADLPPDQYAVEIEQLLAKTNNPDDAESATDAYLYLAMLYSSYKNPDRDYPKALAQIEHHLQTRAGREGLYDANNLKFMLTALTTADARIAALEKQYQAKLAKVNTHAKGLKTKVDQLAQANQTLEQKNAALHTNNRELSSYNKSLLDENKAYRETIERLKSVERQLEQKRKTFK